MDVYIVPKHIYEQYDAEAIYEYDGQDGVGSGPFTVDRGQEGRVRPDGARTPTGTARSRPWTRSIFRIFADAGAQYQALNAGELDAVDDIPAEIFTTLTPTGTSHRIAGNQGDFTELAMNAGCGALGDGHPALKDSKVRQAINYAIDRDLLVEKVLNGLGTPGDALPCRPNPSWYDLGLARGRAASRTTPSEAKALLDEAGWTSTNGNGVREKDGDAS